MLKVLAILSLVALAKSQYGKSRIQITDVNDWKWRGPKGPDSWSQIYPDCKLTLQSPINIPYETVQTCAAPLTFHGLEDAQPRATIQNGYRSAVLFLDPNYPVWVQGGGLPSDHIYHICAIYFTVGSNDTQGSAHTLYNQKYPNEILIVAATGSQKDENDDASTAAIAILSFFTTIAYEENKEWRPIIQALNDIKKAGTETQVNIRSIGALLPQYADWRNNYISYEGSLPWPTCSQATTWIIYPTLIPLSRQQVAAFRVLEDEDGEKITDNVRPLQDIAPRRVLVTSPPVARADYSTGYK